MTKTNMENCRSSDNINVPQVSIAPKKKISESASTLASRFKALLSRPRTSTKTFTAAVPRKNKQKPTALPIACQQEIKTTITSKQTKTNIFGARNNGEMIDPGSTSTASNEVPAKCTTESILVPSKKSTCSTFTAKATVADSTIVAPPSLDTIFANKNGSPVTAKIEEESSIYIYNKQQVKEKVRCAIQEFTKGFREEEETLKAQMALMEQTIEQLEIDERKMAEHDSEVEQIISGFEQATQDIATQKNKEIAALKKENEHLEERQYELTEALKVAAVTEAKLEEDCAAMKAKTEQALQQQRDKHKAEITELQSACAKIQQQRAECDAKFSTVQNSLSALKKECSAIGSCTTQLLTDLETENISLQRAQKTLAKTKEQAEKQLNGARAMVSSKESELGALKKQASELKATIAELENSHRDTETAMKAAAAEAERLAVDIKQEETDKKQAVLQAFDRKQEVEAVKAKIAAEKVKAAELMQVCKMLMDEAEKQS